MPLRRTLVKRFVILVGLLVSAIHALAGPASPLPAGYGPNSRIDIATATPYIVPCIDWLHQTPVNDQPQERARVTGFVLHWLERNPDIDIPMPQYSLKFHGITGELLYMFMEGWVRHTLVTGDTSVVPCSLAGLTCMLDYYAAGNDIARDEYMEKLLQIERSGHLPDLLDTSHNAHNLFLYLKAPYTTHEFKHNENFFSFRYFCVNLVNPRGLHYRYLLDGYYDKWIDTHNEDVTFPGLPPGTYTFRIQASLYPDFSNPVEASYAFHIAKPFWLEYWFLSIIVACIVGIVYLIIRQREKNLKKIATLQHDRIMFEYEHLKSQVNPHFLFNSLNTLASLIARNPDKAIDYTEHLSELYHNIIAYHDNDLVPLSQELAILDNYLLIQKGRFGNALQLQIDVPDHTQATKMIVPLALQILIENAIKHNVVSPSKPLTIRITANGDELEIRNNISPKLSQEKGAGLGLINISRRYGLLTKKQVTYGPHNNEYIVTLPLL